jgi:hypothetical protein
MVVTVKKEIGRLWDQEGSVYSLLFPKNLSGVRMCRCVRAYRFVDRILADTQLSESSYQRRAFFRHGRYFIMSFVALRSASVITKPALALADDDQLLLSKQTNELAELIYAVSEPLQVEKGYLAMFRNLTDAQPLANGVLQRLAEQDALRRAQSEALLTRDTTLVRDQREEPLS